MDENKRLRHELMKAVFEVFEKMYYVFLEPLDEQEPEIDSNAVEIGFSGPLKGKIVAFFPQAMSRLMAANALGLDEGEMTEQILADCRQECLNMLCGNFLQKYDPKTLFHMTLPKGRDGKEGNEGNKEDEAYRLAINFESDRIPVRVEMIIYKQERP